jgi:voltage-gated potassium channel
MTVTDDSGKLARYQRFENATELPLVVLSVAFLVLVVLPEVVDLSGRAAEAVEAASYLIWGAFGVELIVLAVLAPSMRRLARDHWLDVVIVAVPFLRPFRLARLARVIRASSALGRLLAALRRITTRRGVQAYGAITAVVIVGCGLLAWAFEREEEGANLVSAGDGLWWAVVTAFTVGYGDHFPVSAAGRGIAVVVMGVGIGLVGVVTANVAAVYVKDETNLELAGLRAQLDRIEAMLAQQSRERSSGTGA